MAKSSRHRAMPRTPQERPSHERPTPAPATEAVAGAGAGEPVALPSPSTPASPPTPTAGKAPRPASTEPQHVLAGTGCTAGHERGHELDAGRLGTLPSRKRARVGFGLVLWCVGGMALLAVAGIASWTWSSWGAQVALLWLAFAAYVVRRAGHRKRCWRTRTWRHAWGGLAPGS